MWPAGGLACRRCGGPRCGSFPGAGSFLRVSAEGRMREGRAGCRCDRCSKHPQSTPERGSKRGGFSESEPMFNSGFEAAGVERRRAGRATRRGARSRASAARDIPRTAAQIRSGCSVGRVVGAGYAGCRGRRRGARGATTCKVGGMHCQCHRAGGGVRAGGRCAAARAAARGGAGPVESRVAQTPYRRRLNIASV